LIPVRVGGAVVGALSVGTIFSERVWSPTDVQRVKLVAEIFGNAFERKLPKRRFTGSRRNCARREM
jgi:hypothetical protein